MNYLIYKWYWVKNWHAHHKQPNGFLSTECKRCKTKADRQSLSGFLLVFRTFSETFSSLRPEKPWVTKLSSAGLVYIHFGRQLLAHLTQLKEGDRQLEVLYDKVRVSLCSSSPPSTHRSNEGETCLFGRFKDRNCAAALVEKKKRFNACAHFLAVCPKTAGSEQSGKIPQSFLNHGGGCSAPNSLDVRQHEATQIWGGVTANIRAIHLYNSLPFLNGFSLPSVPCNPGSLASFLEVIYMAVPWHTHQNTRIYLTQEKLSTPFLGSWCCKSWRFFSQMCDLYFIYFPASDSFWVLGLTVKLHH